MSGGVRAPPRAGPLSAGLRGTVPKQPARPLFVAGLAPGGLFPPTAPPTFFP
jgi:hypothetical protein